MPSRIDAIELQEALLPLRKFAFSLTRNEEKVDDLVQDSVERALRKQHLFEPGTNLRAWLFTICRRQFLNQIRKQKSRGIQIALEDASQDTFSTQASQEQTMQLQDVIDRFHKLSLQDKVILSLIVMEGLTYEEASTILDIPVGTVRSRLSRARTKLKKSIESQTIDVAAVA